MQVMHGLTGILSAVTDHTIAVCQVFCGSDGGDDFKNVGNHGTVFSGDAINGRDMHLGNHQNVGGCLGVDIPECIYGFVLINLGGGDLPGDNFTE